MHVFGLAQWTHPRTCPSIPYNFQHPVTYHMRIAHPGCGRPAGGRGYNSGGNYCGGWAGNCGDGGVGGSSWYLICEKCREAHQKLGAEAVAPAGSTEAEKAVAAALAASAATSDHPTSLSGTKMQIFNTNVQKSLSAMVTLRKKSSAGSAAATMPPSAKMMSPSGGQLSSHRIMHNNAMFLLDLASSASNSNLVARQTPTTAAQKPPPPPATSVAIGGARSKIPPPSSSSVSSQPLSAVAELSNVDPNPFPVVPFQCLSALGVEVKILLSSKYLRNNCEFIVDLRSGLPPKDDQRGADA